MTNILLVDDHSMIRMGLKLLIENSFHNSNCEEAFDGNSAFEKVKSNDYDLIILDVNMPGTDSFGLLSSILAIKPQSKILMFSMNAEDIFAKRYLKMGAIGYLRKDSEDVEIRDAITKVLNNKRYVSPELKEKLVEKLSNRYSSENPFDKLSPREFEIVQHLCRGDSLAEICQKVNLHSSTVSTHKARIFEKLQCNNVIDLNTLAKLHNVIV